MAFEMPEESWWRCRTARVVRILADFHDAEVMGLELERNGLSRLRVHVTDCALSGFNHQNVLSSLRVERQPEGYKLSLEPCFGLNGSITAERLRIELKAWFNAAQL